MLKKKKRILEVSIVSHNTGGVEKFLYDVFVHLDKDVFAVDFLSPNGGSYDIFRKDIEKNGGKILNLGVDRESLPGKLIYGLRLYSFLRHNKYDVIHINSGAFLFCFQVAAISRLCKQKMIVVHSHSVSQYGAAKAIIVKLLKPLLEKLANELLACSMDAARIVFTSKSVSRGRVKIIPNGIETAKFKFSKEKRIEYRKKLGIDDKFAYVHVGRFVYEKNHEFLIEIFNEIQKIQENAMLFLVGDGKKREAVLLKIREMDIQDKVCFLGLRDDVCELLNAMDALILPSISEGLPLVAVEAQTNGLYTICSDGVPKEASISDLYKTIPLEKEALDWANTIVTYTKRNDVHREEYCANTVQKGFDISSTAKTISEIYQME